MWKELQLVRVRRYELYLARVALHITIQHFVGSIPLQRSILEVSSVRDNKTSDYENQVFMRQLGANLIAEEQKLFNKAVTGGKSGR